MRAMRRDPREAIGSTRGATSDRATGRAHGLLLASEIAFAVVLLIGGGLLLRSFAALADVDPGFHQAGLVTADVLVPPDRYPTRAHVLDFFTRVEDRLGRLPGVRSVSAIDRLPYGPSISRLGFRIQGRDIADAETPLAYNASARPGYFRTMGIPLVAGREFTAADHADAPRSVVVGRSIAERWWPDRSPLGERIQVFGVDWEIVGVVGDIHHLGPSTPADAMLYLPQAQDVATRRMMTIVVRTDGSPEALLAQVRGEIRALDAQLPVEHLRTFGALESERTAGQRFNALLIGTFAMIAVVLAAVGIYGVLSFVVAQRTREIGVRMALGASRGAVMAMFVRLAMRAVIVGGLVGLGIALPLSGFARGMLFGIEPTDRFTYAAVPVLVGLIALAAAWVPAMRAARVSPSTAMVAD